VKQFIVVESECIKIMSYIRAKEVEVEVEEEMAAKFNKDAAEKAASNEVMQKALDEVDKLRSERDAVAEEEDRLKAEHAKLKRQMGRWAGALNSVFKALSVDLESLGVFGGRVTADADLVLLMGVVEAKTQKVLAGYNKALVKADPSGSLSRRTSAPGSPTSAKSFSKASTASPAPPALPPGGLSLPHIPGKSFGQGNAAQPGFGLVGSDEEEEESDDDEDLVKPMSSVDLKRSMRTTLSIGSMTSPKI